MKNIEIYEAACTKKYNDHIPCSFAYKIVSVDDRFSKPVAIYRGKNAAYEFVEVTFKEHKYCKKLTKKHFDKNLVMTEQEEYLFQKSNNCWICEKLIGNDDEKLEIIVI